MKRRNIWQRNHFNQRNLLYTELPFNVRFKEGDTPPSTTVDIKALTPEKLKELNPELHQTLFNAGYGRSKEEVEKRDKNILELNTTIKQLSDGKKLTEEEKEALKIKIAEYEEKTMTADQKAARQVESIKAEYGEKLKGEATKATFFETQFKDSLVERQLVSASIEAKAFSPNQVVSLIAPLAEVREKKDDKGKGTGKFEVIVPMQVELEESGVKKTVIKEFSPKDAVKHFLSLPENANLVADNLVNTPHVGQGGGDGIIDFTKMDVPDIQKNLPAIMDALVKGVKVRS